MLKGLTSRFFPSINKVAPARYRDQLIPTYSYGARRPVFDVNYLDTCMCVLLGRSPITAADARQIVHRPNVELYTEHAQACTATHILRQDGQAIPADIIIAATGTIKREKTRLLY